LFLQGHPNTINTFSDRNNVALSTTPSVLLKSRKTFKDERNLPIMEPQETKFFPFQAGSFLSLGLYTSSAKEQFPFSHIPFEAGYTLLTFMSVLFEVIRNVNVANTFPTCS